MSHLSCEEILGYLDGDKSAVDLKKASRHLDTCERCTSILKDFASISILLELITLRAKELREKEILGKCPDAEMMFYFIENRLSTEKRMKIEKHLKECESCQKELKVIRATEEVHEAQVPEVREPERILPKILRYFELYFVAYEREEVIAKEKKFRIPGLETIRKIISPRQPVLVPLGFAALTKRDKEFYRELDNKQLMHACKAGDYMAWRELGVRFQNYAYKVISAYGLSEECKDIWNEVIASLATSIKKYEERGKARAFIRGIVVNKCRKSIREKIKEEKFFKRMCDQIKQKSEGSDLLDQLVEKKKAKHLIENITRMPKDFSLILMALIEGLDDKEIAHRLNIRKETVRTRKLRARVRLLEMKKNDSEFMSKIRRFKWVKRNFYKLFTPQ